MSACMRIIIAAGLLVAAGAAAETRLDEGTAARFAVYLETQRGL